MVSRSINIFISIYLISSAVELRANPPESTELPGTVINQNRANARADVGECLRRSDPSSQRTCLQTSGSTLRQRYNDLRDICRRRACSENERLDLAVLSNLAYEHLVYCRGLADGQRDMCQTAFQQGWDNPVRQPARVGSRSSANTRPPASQGNPCRPNTALFGGNTRELDCSGLSRTRVGQNRLASGGFQQSCANAQLCHARNAVVRSAPSAGEAPIANAVDAQPNLLVEQANEFMTSEYRRLQERALGFYSATILGLQHAQGVDQCAQGAVIPPALRSQLSSCGEIGTRLLSRLSQRPTAAQTERCRTSLTNGLNQNRTRLAVAQCAANRLRGGGASGNSCPGVDPSEVDGLINVARQTDGSSAQAFVDSVVACENHASRQRPSSAAGNSGASIDTIIGQVRHLCSSDPSDSNRPTFGELMSRFGYLDRDGYTQRLAALGNPQLQEVIEGLRTCSAENRRREGIGGALADVNRYCGVANLAAEAIPGMGLVLGAGCMASAGAHYLVTRQESQEQQNLFNAIATAEGCAVSQLANRELQRYMAEEAAAGREIRNQLGFFAAGQLIGVARNAYMARRSAQVAGETAGGLRGFFNRVLGRDGSNAASTAAEVRAPGSRVAINPPEGAATQALPNHVQALNDPSRYRRVGGPSPSDRQVYIPIHPEGSEAAARQAAREAAVAADVERRMTAIRSRSPGAQPGSVAGGSESSVGNAPRMPPSRQNVVVDPGRPISRDAVVGIRRGNGPSDEQSQAAIDSAMAGLQRPAPGTTPGRAPAGSVAGDPAAATPVLRSNAPARVVNRDQILPGQRGGLIGIRPSGREVSDPQARAAAEAALAELRGIPSGAPGAGMRTRGGLPSAGSAPGRNNVVIVERPPAAGQMPPAVTPVPTNPMSGSGGPIVISPAQSTGVAARDSVEALAQMNPAVGGMPVSINGQQGVLVFQRSRAGGEFQFVPNADPAILDRLRNGQPVPSLPVVPREVVLPYLDGLENANGVRGATNNVVRPATMVNPRGR